MSRTNADHSNLQTRKPRRPSHWILLLVCLGPAAGFLTGEPFQQGPGPHKTEWLAGTLCLAGWLVGATALVWYCRFRWRAWQKRAIASGLKSRGRMALASTLGFFCVLVVYIWGITYTSRIHIMPDFTGPGPYGVELLIGAGDVYVRQVVSCPMQRVRDDGWEFGVRWLWIGYTGTYQSPHGVLMHGVNYSALAPLWLFAVALAAYPVLFLVRARRAQQHGAGQFCGTCGYNLTGNVSGICPECGTHIGGTKASG